MVSLGGARMNALIIATRNGHKVEEIAAMLGGSIPCVGLGMFQGVPEVVEDGLTFHANAAKKCFTVARWLAQNGEAQRQIPGWGDVGVLADDSGLEVDALGGAPGIHSARFAALDQPAAAGNSPDGDNNRKLLRLLEDVAVSRRTARFRCVLALVRLKGNQLPAEAEYCDGTCEGHIQRESAGAGGFGYDPLFVPAGYAQSFAELGAAEKNRISHRARAMVQLRALLGV